MGIVKPLKTALVLAGGKGERLRPLTDNLPKPMVPILGRPLLEYHLHWLRQQGIERAVLLAGYLQDVIRQHFRVERIPGLTIECIGEDQPLGRGGALRNGFLEAGIQDEILVATNGDIITNQELLPLQKLHEKEKSLATILLTGMVSPYGVVDVGSHGQIVSFQEKPKLPYYINGGVYVLSGAVLDRFPELGDHETGLFPELVEEGTISGLKSEAFWCSVETKKDIDIVEEFVSGHELFTGLVTNH